MIGQGSYGTIYRAYCSKTGKKVVLKHMQSILSTESDSRCVSNEIFLNTYIKKVKVLTPMIETLRSKDDVCLVFD